MKIHLPRLGLSPWPRGREVGLRAGQGGQAQGRGAQLILQLHLVDLGCESSDFCLERGRGNEELERFLLRLGNHKGWKPCWVGGHVLEVRLLGVA